MRARAYVRSHKGLVAAVVLAGVAVTAFAIYWFGPQYLFIDRRVDEAVAGEFTVVAEGELTGLAHGSSGSAMLIRLEDGSYQVRFEDLSTSNGPDLRVYLSNAPADGDPDALDDDFVDLGGLKGNQGNQNYDVPAGTDPSSFRSVVVWCRRFSVGFAVAPLEQG
jgi:hypothetical protein